MKKFLLIALSLISAVPLFAVDKQKDNRLFEEAMARDEEPATKVYIHPQIADMQMLSKTRETFGPYKFKLIKPGEMTEGELSNAQGRALYRATLEADADLMIGTLYDTYITEEDAKYVVVELSAYPAKFVNFRPLPLDSNSIHMVNICYPTLPTDRR